MTGRRTSSLVSLEVTWPMIIDVTFKVIRRTRLLGFGKTAWKQSECLENCGNCALQTVFTTSDGEEGSHKFKTVEAQSQNRKEWKPSKSNREGKEKVLHHICEIHSPKTQEPLLTMDDDTDDMKCCKNHTKQLKEEWCNGQIWPYP